MDTEHLDNAPTAIRQRNDMTNIWPQAAQMNRRASLLTERL